MNASLQTVEQHIFYLRGQRVMLSSHLAEFYGIEPRSLIQAVKRNAERFPSDFMFQLDAEEFAILKSQIVISSWGGSRALPYAFTEQGVAMLSSVLRSPQAIQVNVAIMRAFVRIRGIMLNNKELSLKLAEIERKLGKHDEEIQVLFNVIKKMMAPPPVKPKRLIGFQAPSKTQPKRRIKK